MPRPKNPTPRIKLTIIYGDDTTKSLSIRSELLTIGLIKKITAFINECLTK